MRCSATDAATGTASPQSSLHFVGLLALCVSGYTAYLQRQQVRAQVWPYLEPGISGSKRDVMLFNKGVWAGHHPQREDLLVDGKPQPNWNRPFLAALASATTITCRTRRMQWPW